MRRLFSSLTGKRNMSNVLIVLSFGFIAIQFISIMLFRKAKKHLGGSASFFHLFVAAIAAYYLIDLLLYTAHLFYDPFFYFWLSNVVLQIALYILGKRRSTARNQ
jgi:hypothetical protein